MTASSPLLSICIPTYNGSPAIFDLIESLLQSKRDDFQIVISDDCSVDDTWSRINKIASLDSRLVCYRNQLNLGMDRNFAQSVVLAKGSYVWLCGQDDMISTTGLDRVLYFLAVNRDVDFIYFNHAKRVESATGSYLIEAAIQSEHVFGKGLTEFILHTKYRLPTFLPTYLMRRDLWNSVDIEKYYGTCYCQVGVFLEASKKLNWCHFSGNIVTGLLPSDGWQKNPSSFVKIAFGYFAMTNRAANKTPEFDYATRDKHYYLLRRHLIYAFILYRHFALNIDPVLVDEVLKTISPFSHIAVPVSRILNFNRAVIFLAYHAITIRRKLREILSSVSWKCFLVNGLDIR